jgi:hypothetical protein
MISEAIEASDEGVSEIISCYISGDDLWRRVRRFWALPRLQQVQLRMMSMM